VLRAGASTRNPVDMLATAGPAQYRRTMRALSDDAGVDALIAIYTPTGLDDPSELLQGIAAGVDAVEGRIPVALVALTRDASRGLIEGRHGSAPVYPFPDDAARALGHAVRRAAWLERPTGTVAEFDDVRPEIATAAVAAALADGAGWLDPAAVSTVLGAYGLDLIEARSARTPADAGAAADAIGGRVALKAAAADVVHKSEAGAVRLGLSGGAEVAREARRMKRALHADGHDVDSFLVQRMADDGIEMLVGVVHDRSFGPVVVCGAGGVAAEVLRDLSARITPLTDLDAKELVDCLRIAPLLHGWRGAAPADLPALEQTLLRIDALVEAHPEIVELDLNPVVVSPNGACIVDARIRVQEAPPPQPWPSVESAGPERVTG
jgi:acyl-CoA synthetase (NDP forming)